MKKYSLITYLVGEEFKKVRELQRKISEVTGSTKCLTDWEPHITIGDGPEITDDQLPELEGKLQEFANRQQSFTSRIAGFGGIDNWKGAVEGEITPYVIWLNVEVNPELKKCWGELRDSITSQYPTWLPRTETYVPHVTLAFADLTKEGYERGMEYLAKKDFQSKLTISHIALVECFGEGNMTSREYKRFILNETE